MNIYSFDIDGTICSNTYGKYDKAQPFLDRIESINTLLMRNIGCGKELTMKKIQILHLHLISLQKVQYRLVI